MIKWFCDYYQCFNGQSGLGSLDSFSQLDIFAHEGEMLNV